LIPLGLSQNINVYLYRCIDECDKPMSDEQRECPKCGASMIKRENYLPDDYNLTEIKKFWLCGSCMYYEPIE